MDTTCDNCNKKIKWSIYRYNGWGLCLDCQKEKREKEHPTKLAKFINEQVDRKNYR